MAIKSDLKTLLYMSTLAVILIPTFIIGVSIFLVLDNTMRQEILNKNLMLAHSLSAEIEMSSKASLNELQDLRYNISKSKSNLDIQSYLESTIKNHPYFSQIIILDTSGKVRHIYPYNKDYIGLDMSRQRFYIESKNNPNAYWSPTTISPATGYPTTYLSISFAQGVIVGQLDLSFLRHINQKNKVSNSGYFIITDQNGTIISHKDVKFINEQYSLNYPELVEISKKETTLQYNLMGNSDDLISVALIPSNLWAAILVQPVKKAFASVNKIITLIYAGYITIILVMVLSCLVIARKLSGPLIKLKDSTKRVAAGDYNTPFDIANYDSYLEVRELAFQFNQMIQAIKNREETLSFAKFSLDNAHEAMFWFDSFGKCLNANTSARHLLGFNKEELLSKSISDIDINSSIESFYHNFKVLKNANTINFETTCKTSDGRLFPADMTYSLLNYKGQEYIFIFMRDITDRKSAEELIANEKELLQSILRSIGEGVIYIDIEGTITLMNDMAKKILGYGQEAIGMQIDDIFHVFNIKTKLREQYSALLLQKKNLLSYSNKYTLITKSGEEKTVLLALSTVNDQRSRVIGTVMAFQDITEQIRMEEELLKADKLESLGLLAGGIAHDFNNQLTGILGNIGLARIFLKEDKNKAYARLGIAEKAVENAQNLTKQLMTFAKGGSPIKVASSIEKVIRETVDFSLRGSNVKCEISIAEGISPVEIDEGQMSRVINNLIINSCQAMPDGGIINIGVENTTIEKESNLPIESGRYVLVTIKDQGIGIPENNINIIFDPYFTTKNKGSGLGLSVAYSIVKKHSGLMTVESKVNQGTTFYIYLPALENEVHIVTPDKDNQIIIHGKGKILVMDDEEDIRLLASELLHYLGYEAQLSKDGEEAFELYKKAKEAGQPFDAVIMDLTVPGGMGGEELIAQLLRYDPDVKAIVSSGYSNNLVIAFYSDFGFCGYICKPFKIENFSQVLHKALNSQGNCI